MIPALGLIPIIGCRVAIHKFTDIYLSGTGLVKGGLASSDIEQDTHIQFCNRHLSANGEGSYHFPHWI